MNTAHYPRYEHYKDSGTDWLGEIPSDWEIVPAFKCIKENKVKNIGLIENTVLSLSYGKIIVKPEEKMTGLVPESFETYQIVEPNDIIIRCTDLQNDKVSLRTGLVNNKGIITSAYLGLKVLNNYNARFLHYYLHNLDITKAIYKFGTGLRQNLSFLDFKRLPLLNISNELQTAIADFLDQKTAQIDQAIALKQAQIDKLNEYKQIIIQKAVTHGLNPNALMKNSGVDWIGDIPEHWEVEKLGRLLINFSEKNHAHLPLLSITREQGVILRDIEDQESNHNFIPDDLSGYKLLKKGQFGMNKMKAWQGSYGISKFTGIVSPAYYIFDIDKKLDNDFFNLAIRSKFYVGCFASASDGVRIGQWDLNKTRMREIPFIIPSIEEQKAIYDFSLSITKQVRIAITNYQTQIDRLKEYRHILINQAVTGKIKVC